MGPVVYGEHTMYLRAFGGAALEETEFTRRKPLLLLAYLAVEGPQSRRRVAELFWPNASDHMKSLTVALSRIRKGAPGAVAADRERVWVTLDSDAARFLELVEGRDLRAALELYRGPFLAGFHLRRWSVELEEWVFRTREVFAAHARGAHLTLGEREAAADRWDRAERHAAEALGMDAELLEPDELGRLHTLLLASGSSLAAAARRRAEEYELELCTTEAEARARLGAEARAQLGFGARASERERRHNLPSRARPFVGRASELRHITALFERRDCRLVTLQGPAGVGKSRLALELAREAVRDGRFPDGVYLVPLAPLASADGVPHAIAEAIGIGPSGHGSELTDLIGAIGSREVLLVLDTFEHLLDAARILPELIAACARVRVAVASRVRLRLEEEHVVAVRGLRWPQADGGGGRTPTVAEAREFEAVQLFVRRAQQANPSFELTAETVGGVVEVCRLVEGLPLGLELAATWLRILPAREIAAEIARSPDFLVSRSRNVPDRHRSLRSAFEHSWELLSVDEKRVMRQASVFRGGFHRHAASSVAGATIPILASLVEKSLLRVDETGRYGRHPLLYQFMQEKAAERPQELHAAGRRHARWWIGLLVRVEDDLAGALQSEAIARITADLDNVRAAWRWAAEHRAVAELRAGCRPLQLFYIQRGGMAAEAAEAFRRAADVLDPAAVAERDVLGRLRAAEAWFRFLLGDHEEATLAGERALDSLGPTDVAGNGGADDVRVSRLRAIASAENTLATIAKRRGRYDAARRRYRAAMDVAERLGNDRQVALFKNNLALLEKDLGRYEVAERLYREAIAINRRLGNHRSVVRNLTNLGAALIFGDRPGLARGVLEEARELADEIGYDQVIPSLMINLGGAAYASGDFARARSFLEEVLAHGGDGGDPSRRADVIQMVARIEAAEDDVPAALAKFRRALEMADPVADRAAIADALGGLAALFLACGDAAAAIRSLELAGDGDGMPHHVARGLREGWRTAEGVAPDQVRKARAALGGFVPQTAADEALELIDERSGRLVHDARA